MLNSHHCYGMQQARISLAKQLQPRDNLVTTTCQPRKKDMIERQPNALIFCYERLGAIVIFIMAFQLQVNALMQLPLPTKHGLFSDNATEQNASVRHYHSESIRNRVTLV